VQTNEAGGYDPDVMSYNLVLGSQQIGPTYSFTPEGALVEGARWVGWAGRGQKGALHACTTSSRSISMLWCKQQTKS
jgi:hypothetical protein